MSTTRGEIQRECDKVFDLESEMRKYVAEKRVHVSKVRNKNFKVTCDGLKTVSQTQDWANKCTAKQYQNKWVSEPPTLRILVKNGASIKLVGGVAAV